MYRTYCDPYAIEQRIEEVQKHIKEHPDDIDAVIDLYRLKDELNFAWQDDEYDIEEE